MLRQITWIVAILAAGSFVVAEDQPTDRPLLSGPEARQSGERGGRDFSGRERAQRPGDRLEEVLAKLELTDEQREQIQKIVADHVATMQERGRKMQEAQQALQAAQQSGDEEAVKTARENLRQLFGQGWDPGALVRKIEPVLTDEQKQQLHEALPQGPGFGPGGPMGGGPWGPGANDPIARMQGAFGQLDLTEEQRSKIRAILDEHQQAIRKEIEGVLTPEQLEKFHGMQERRGAGGRDGRMGPGPRRHGPPAEDSEDDQLNL